jgi:undecaprenyl-diphosphatase
MRRLLHRFDTKLTTVVLRLPKRWYAFFGFVSASGFPFVTLGIACSFLLASFWHADLLRYALAIFAAQAAGSLLKVVFGRKRPATYTARAWFIRTHSFPSGHSTGAMAAYGTLGLWTVAAYPIIAVFLLLWIFLVGISRVYLGAHYPSDVVAGWILGLVFVLVV